jgi:hypothetical protein
MELRMLNARHALPLAVLAFAFGCTRTAERPATGDTSAVAQSIAPAAAAPSDSGELTVTERGIGPLRAGMTVAAASAALGGALAVPAGGDTASCTYARWRGGPPGVRVMIAEGRIARVDVDSSRVATATGVRVGDDESRVQSLYPARVVVSPSKYEKGHVLTVTPSAGDSTLAIVFETVGGRVTRYRAGRRPEVEYVEGCG